MAIQELKSHKSFGGLSQFWEHTSRETRTKMRFSTFVPAERPRGCIIWLSGLTCTEENFLAKAGAQRCLQEKGLMVICPDTSPRGLNLPGEHESWDFGNGASFYVDAATAGYNEHYRMASYVANELLEIVHADFSIAQDCVSIMGHSMGGHGALTLGLREPEKFRSISAFAPIANPVSCPWGRKAFSAYLGASPSDWRRYDATELIMSGSRHEHAILIDQGTKDEFLTRQLLPDNFVKACAAAKQPLAFHLRDGYDHSYYFVASFIEDHITFHARALG